LTIEEDTMRGLRNKVAIVAGGALGISAVLPQFASLRKE